MHKEAARKSSKNSLNLPSDVVKQETNGTKRATKAAANTTDDDVL